MATPSVCRQMLLARRRVTVSSSPWLQPHRAGALQQHHYSQSAQTQARPQANETPAPAAKAAAEARLRSMLQILGATAALLGIGTIAWVQLQEQSSSQSSAGLHPERFKPLMVLSNRTCTSLARPHEAGDGLHRHVELGLGPDAEAPAVPPGALQISSIYIKQPDIQIERAYTPLFPPSTAVDVGKIDLLVKRYETGEMGRYIHRKPPGATLDVRGWSKTWDSDWHPFPTEHIYLVVGGTGITPAFQLINAVLSEKSARKPRFTLLYAAPRPSSFLLLPELANLQRRYADHLDVRLWAEDTSSLASKWLGILPTAPEDIESLPLKQGRIALSDLRRSLSSSKPGAVVLVCGPEGFVQTMAGPLSRDGQSQGPLRGYLKELGFSAEQVHKL